MRVKISLTRPPSAVQLGSIAPTPHPSIVLAQSLVRCQWEKPPHIVVCALVATAWVRRARPPRSCPLSDRSGSLCCSPAVGPTSAQPPTPTLFNGSVYLQSKPFGVHPFGVIRRAGARFPPLPPAPLPLRRPVRPLRSRPPCLRSAVKKGRLYSVVSFLLFCGGVGVAPLGVSLVYVWFIVKSIRRAPFGVLGSLSLLLGFGGLPLSKTGVSRASKTPVKN